MPAATIIGAVIGGLTTGGGIAAFFGISATAGFLIGAAATGLSLNYLRNQLPGAFEPAPPDIDFRQSIPAAVAPARHIYGRARVGGLPIFVTEFQAGTGNETWQENGDRFNILTQINLLSEGDIEGIEKTWINGTEAVRFGDTTFGHNGSITASGDEHAAPTLDDPVTTTKAEITKWETRKTTLETAYPDTSTMPVGVAALYNFVSDKLEALEAQRDDTEWAYRLSVSGIQRWVHTFGFEVYRYASSAGFSDFVRPYAGLDTVPLGNGKWHAHHSLLGMSAVGIYFRSLESPPDGPPWNNAPRAEFLVKGKRITWPGQSNPVWTENAAAIYHDWLVNVQGVDADDIDRNSFDAAYATCNELIAIPEIARGDDAADKPIHASDILEANFGADQTAWPTVAVQDVLIGIWNDQHAGANNAEIRYSINGVVDTSMDPQEVERQFNAAWNGYIVERGGKIYFEPGKSKAAVLTIGEDDLVAGASPTWEIEPPLSQRATSMHADLVASAKHDDLNFSVPAVKLEGATDNYPKDVGQWAYVQYPLTATRLLNSLLKRANGGKKVRLTLGRGDNWAHYNLAPTDRVILNLESEGDTGSTYFVEEVITTMDGTVELGLSQEAAGTYTDTVTVPLDPDIGAKFVTANV